MNRRQFLNVVLTLFVGAFAVALKKLLGLKPVASIADAGEWDTFFPYVSRSESESINPAPTGTTTPPEPTATAVPEPVKPKVIHVHSEDATSWDGIDPYYWNYVDQDVVNEMVDQGLMALTGTTSIADAWHSLLPNYQPGQGIAIKVNFNNTTTCDDSDSQIDAIIHPVNSIIRGLKQRGVLEQDIWIFDAIRSLPNRFTSGCLYENVVFYDKGYPDGCNNESKFLSDDLNANVKFSVPPDIPFPPTIRISDVLINGDYLINVPIMKRHEMAGVSLGFKNHFGTINDPRSLHDYIGVFHEYFYSDYNPLVDLYMNPHIRFKTVLTLADGLFASKSVGSPPSYWGIFDNQVPNSLFFSQDPVAIDCVMYDFLKAEIPAIPDTSQDYLQLASTKGLGVYENGNPLGSGYSIIGLQRIEI